MFSDVRERVMRGCWIGTRDTGKEEEEKRERERTMIDKKSTTERTKKEKKV